MITLLSKRQAAASRTLPDTEEPEVIKDHAEWKAVVEGFTLLQNDLLKLQVRIRFLFVAPILTVRSAICGHQRHWLQKDPQEVGQAFQVYH
jgi:hypothetical protein